MEKRHFNYRSAIKKNWHIGIKISLEGNEGNEEKIESTKMLTEELIKAIHKANRKANRLYGKKYSYELNTEFHSE